MPRFEGRTILVTGATSGLGQSCAHRLREEGASLVLVGRNQAALDEFTDGRKFTCDVSDESAIRELAAKLKGEGIKLSGCVLAAGTQDIRPLMMETQATLLTTWASNVNGSLGLLASLLKGRLIEKGGSVVLFSSAAVHAGGAGLVSYSAAKGALEGATKSLAMEVAGQKIRVNAVAPGMIPTPMSRKYLSKLSPEQVAAVEAQHPLGFGEPRDVAGPVAFLLSDDARWITGQVLVIDGGLSSH